MPADTTSIAQQTPPADVQDPPPRRWGIPLPRDHYMVFAPLDVWLRMLFFPLVVITPRYWIRLGGYLITSTLSTIVTLPERILLGLWLRLVPWNRSRVPGPVFILGYYRSGTTHLHYLLDCDRRHFSPKWFHVLMPQGFLLSWTLCRLLLIAIMSGKRPMDGVGMGPEYPSEDQFAVNNWGLACALLGKSVLPQACEYYDRYHNLEQLTPSELNRFRRCQLWFIRKLAMLAGRRRVLLKSPNHTAHVEQLIDLLHGVPDVKFIHITRDPHKVLKSNVNMYQTFQEIWNLQEPMPRAQLQETLLEEYLDSERRYLAARDKIPPGQLVEVRIQDLHADPLGELRRVYDELQMEYTPEFEQHVIEYLSATRDFRPNVHQEWSPEENARLTEQLAPLVTQFGHDRPARPKVALPQSETQTQAARGPRVALGALAATAVALGLGALWLAGMLAGGESWAAACNRLVWPLGLAAGFAAHRTARGGSLGLGIWTTVLTAAVMIANNVLFAGGPGASSADLWTTFDQYVLTFPVLFWTGLGLVTAYRLGSRPR